jgi:hypothetical protein
MQRSQRIRLRVLPGIIFVCFIPNLKKQLMKKQFILSLTFVFCLGFFAGAQDYIYKKDGSKEAAKIILVSEKEVQYKKFNNLEGPVYSIPKRDITLITYENGDYEAVKSPESAKKAAKTELAENFAKNLITYQLFDVVYGDFTFAYERILASGSVGIKIPFGFGYAYSSGFNNWNTNRVYNLFYSGIGVNFYPTGQGKWRYFVGPNIRIGYGKDIYWQSYYDQYGNYISDGEVSNEGIYTKFFMDNGLMFTPVKNFCVSAVVGVGVRYFPNASESNNSVMPTGYFSMNVSYRF